MPCVCVYLARLLSLAILTPIQPAFAIRIIIRQLIRRKHKWIDNEEARTKRIEYEQRDTKNHLDERAKKTHWHNIRRIDGIALFDLVT